MTQLFILQNQDKLFLSKKSEWLDGRDLASLYRTPNKDEAVNQLFEVNSKDYSQRIQLLCCPATEKGLPDIDPAIMPEPQARQLDLTEESAACDAVSSESNEFLAADKTLAENSDDVDDQISFDDEAVAGDQLSELAVRQA